jgi:hypothetical protein
MYKANLLKYAETAWQSGLSTPSNWLKIQVFTVLKVFFTSQTLCFSPKLTRKPWKNWALETSVALGVRGPFHAAGVAVGAGTYRRGRCFS